MFGTMLRQLTQRPVAMTMGYLVVLATGVYSLWHLPLELNPEVDFARVTITTIWPNTSPETVEAYVTAPIEAEASTVQGVRSVESTSEEGLSSVTLEFTRETDMDYALLELGEKLSLVRRNLPYGVYPPQIQKYVPKEFQAGHFLSYRLTGPYPLHWLRSLAKEKIRPSLLGVEGVAGVEVLGGSDRELEIRLERDLLEAAGVDLWQVQQRVLEVAQRTAAGYIRQDGARIALVVENPVLRPEDLLNEPVACVGGRLIRIRDVGTVVDTYSEPLSLTRVDGNPAVLLVIHREPGTHVLAVARRVKRKLDELRSQLPPGLRLITEEDQSERIRRELATLGERAAFSLGAIFLVLWLFLRSVWSPAIILSTALFSVLLTLNAFAAARLTANLLTLAGLALGFGILVDNSIVVWENIVRHAAEGASPESAALNGTREVALPIVASTLTTVSVFIPFLYLTGDLRVYYLPFAMAVAFSLLASLLVAFTFIRAVARLALGRTGWGRSGSQGLSARIQGAYPVLLGGMIRRRGWVLGGVGALVVFSWWFFGSRVPRGPLWSWATPNVLYVLVNMPEGTPLERADEVARKFEKIAVGRPGVERVFTRVGRDRADIRISFPDSVLFTAFPYLLREELTLEAARTSGVTLSIFGLGPTYLRGGGVGADFCLYVLGYNYREVCRYADELAARLRLNPRVRNIRITGGMWSSLDHTELVLEPIRHRLAQAGLSVADLQSQVAAHLRETLGWQEMRIGSRELGSELVSYRIKMAGHERLDVRDLGNVLLHGRNGSIVRLSEVARLEERRVPGEICRKDQQYRRTLLFEFAGPGWIGHNFVESILTTTHLPPGYKIEQPAFTWGEDEKQRRQLWLTVLLALILVYMVTAALFESLGRPLLVMLAVPMALVGTFWIFYFTGTSFGRSAYIGVVLLAGIVVNNAILLVYRIGQLRQEGCSPQRAAILGGSQRLRPILMTSATTIFGMLPLVLFTSEEESLWYALSLATMGGLASSTLLVLVAVPLLLSGPLRWPKIGRLGQTWRSRARQ
ncbi:MAG: efflux RND transporter permease subunit [candidate division KSB1 bacterium]|nr:efflux RND transporter permease subunit [candidate division KSB1 bacterium]